MGASRAEGCSSAARPARPLPARADAPHQSAETSPWQWRPLQLSGASATAGRHVPVPKRKAEAAGPAQPPGRCSHRVSLLKALSLASPQASALGPATPADRAAGP